MNSTCNPAPLPANAAPVPFGALAFLFATAMIIVFLAHHPVVGGAFTAREGLERIIQLGNQDELVHAFISIAVAALLYGAIELGLALGLSHAPTAFGLASYGAGCVFVIGAMLLDGFVTPMTAARLSQEGALAASAGPSWIVISASIQVLTKAGLCGIGTGMALLSAACWRRPGGRIVAVLGPLAGLLPPLAAVLMGARMNPHILLLMASAQGCWNLAAGAFLWRRRAEARTPAGA